jgi:hypothetical protein
MLKIVFVSFYNLNSGGGINEWLVEVGNRLSKRNDIDILTSTRGPEMLEARSRLNGPNLVEAPSSGVLGVRALWEPPSNCFRRPT